MILLFAILLIVAGLGIAAAWLGNNPGDVTMIWFGYEIETSVAFLVLCMAVAAILASAAYALVHHLLLMPRHYSARRSLRHYRQGLEEITYSVAALAASDMKNAELHTKRAEKQLGRTPLTLLLRAQISKNLGTDEETRQLLEQLLGFKETEYLAAKSLSDAELKQQHVPQAIALAKRASDIEPKQSQAAWTLFDLHLNSGEIEEALAHAKHARKKGGFTRSDYLQAEGKIAYRQALQAQAGNKQVALDYAKKALKCMPHDPDAVLLAATLYSDLRQDSQALKLIRAQWKIAPSEKLALLFSDLIQEQKLAKQDKLRAQLKALNPDSPCNAFL